MKNSYSLEMGDDTMNESRLNIELLKKVREKIATTPEAYDQSVFARPESAAPCGTAACIAGWACVLSGEMSTDELKRRERSHGAEFESIEITATRVLALAEDEAEVLFTEDPAGERKDWYDDDEDWYDDDERDGGWPEPFATQWEDGAAPERIAVAYLDHIIETGKVLE